MPMTLKTPLKVYELPNGGGIVIHLPNNESYYRMSDINSPGDYPQCRSSFCFVGAAHMWSKVDGHQGIVAQTLRMSVQSHPQEMMLLRDDRYP